MYYLLFFLVFANGLLAQTTKISCNSSETLICANITSCSIKADQTVTFYWYRAGTIHNTQGNFTGSLLHGSYESFYKNNNLFEKGTFKLGRKTGKWYTWYPDGKLKEIAFYKNGTLHGAYSIFNQNGELLYTLKYLCGKLSGKAVFYNSAIETCQFKEGLEKSKHSKPLYSKWKR